MKIKNIAMTLGLALALGLGVGAGLSAGKDEVKEASAWNSGTTYYCLTGKFDGVAHWDNYVDAPSDGNNAGVLLNQSLKAGDTFKFKQKDNWDNPLDFGNFYSSAGAYQAFYWENGSSNVYCGATGVYNFYIWQEEGGAMKVSAEFADSNTATYSYVMTLNSNFICSYMYSGSQKQREWASAPAVDGHEYGIKFRYSNYDYYGLYRLDDRIINGWTNIILKNDTQQSSDISRTSGNKQELYL